MFYSTRIALGGGLRNKSNLSSSSSSRQMNGMERMKSLEEKNRGKREMNTLVLGEHNNKKVSASTFSAITAGTKLGNQVSLLLLGSFEDTSSFLEQVSSTQGLSKIYLVNDPQLKNGLAERVAPVVHQFQQHVKATHVIAPSTASGKNIIPRVASLLDVSPISDVIEIKSQDTFVHPIYAGNAIATVKSNDPVKVFTVRTTAFDKASQTGGKCSVENGPQDLLKNNENNSKLSEWVSEEVKTSARPELTSASVVVSGGRGMKSGENFKLLEALADQLGGAVGASRAAVDAGFVSNDLQVGQTGKIVAPELYIAVGISGAIQHLAGMKDSKVIVNINKDSEAPISTVADFTLNKDLFEVVPELTEAIKKIKGTQ
eukprot:TRINITY_DN969_c0_g1_i1.p1 TRINITY_DN969_c0_g1~~TRINITY_DN969_c0_g1_i1.p1  ORF type:complete len:373 (-),score=108.36 TRINITY_DN969_c0_g1_i1:59-1177(-)